MSGSGDLHPKAAKKPGPPYGLSKKPGPPFATVKIKRGLLLCMMVRPETHNGLKPPKTLKKVSPFWGNILSCVVRKKFRSTIRGSQNFSWSPPD